MIALLLIALLLVVLFAGLGIFVAKLFFIGLLVAAVVAIIGGFGLGRGTA